MATESARNMRLLAHDQLNGCGNCGEGMAIQLTRDGRRILWLAHESPPKNVTAVDVTEPRKPGIIVQSDLPHGEMRSNSLDVVGDLLVVAHQPGGPRPSPAPSPDSISNSRRVSTPITVLPLPASARVSIAHRQAIARPSPGL